MRTNSQHTSLGESLIQETRRGLYCPQGDFYIDPSHAVPRAVVTHAHSDHARRGAKMYLSHRQSLPIIKQRLGDVNARGLEYGEKININGVKVSLHPAGHIVGSAQVRLEYRGQVWVVSGDYKLENDGVSAPFEPVPCDVFITESTFGLPVYRWPKQEDVFSDLNAWWKRNQAQGKMSLVLGYALGKAQRIVKNLDLSLGPVYAHGSVWHINELLRGVGADLPFVKKLDARQVPPQIEKSLIVATSTVLNASWLGKVHSFATAYCSGWMLVQSARRRHSADKPVILSDHADWPGLNNAVEASRAKRVYVMHGSQETFARWLCEKGYDAWPVSALRNDLETDFRGELR